MSAARVTDAMTSLAARTFPPSRRADAVVVRDCAREAIDAGGARVVAAECVSLLGAGLRARIGVAGTGLRSAPWRAALSELTLPLSTALLLLWTYGFVPRYDHWPLGYGWTLLLGGSLLAVVGAAFGSRWLTAAGALATFVAAASPYLGMGTEVALADTPSFFHGWGVDLGAASLLPNLLLLAGALSLPPRRPGSTRAALLRLELALLPALIAAVALRPAAVPQPTYGMVIDGPGVDPRIVEGSPYPMPWLPASRSLLVILGFALAAAIITTWVDAGRRPARALASGLVLVSVAYPLAWLGIQYLPVPYWLYNGLYPLLLAVLPLLAALALARRATRTSVS